MLLCLGTAARFATEVQASRGGAGGGAVPHPPWPLRADRFLTGSGRHLLAVRRCPVSGSRRTPRSACAGRRWRSCGRPPAYPPGASCPAAGSASRRAARWGLSVAAVGSTGQAKLAGDRSDRRPRRWGRLGRRPLRSVVWECRSYRSPDWSHSRPPLERSASRDCPGAQAPAHDGDAAPPQASNPRVRTTSTPWNCLRAARQATWPPVGRDRLRRVRR